MRATIHAKIEIAIVAILLLGSCDTQHTPNDAYDLADVARANSANALSQIEELEGRIDDLESKAALNEANIRTAFSNAEADRNVANENSAIINRALNRLEDVEVRLGM